MVKDNFIEGRIPPHNRELEEAVLGAMMLEKHCISLVIPILSVEHFYVPEHRHIYQAITELFESGSPVELLTVSAKLRDAQLLDVIGGSYYLAQLTSKVASSANIEFHARILNQEFIRRECIRISAKLSQNALESKLDPFQVVSELNQELYNTINSVMKRNVLTFGEALQKTLKSLEKAGGDGIRSGFPTLDNCLGGFQPSDLIIIAARPAMGKTALVGYMAQFISSMGVPVGFFSLEMSAEQLMRRFISGQTGIDSRKFRTNDLTHEDWDRIHRMDNLPIFIDDTPALSLVEMQAKARQMYSAGCRLIIVDYLQLMRVSGSLNREQEINQISQGLKNIAKDLNIPVIALAQLSRAVELRGDKTPQLSDLRESGGIEQAADSVVFIMRPEYYDIKDVEVNGTVVHSAGITLLNVEKNRHGSLSNVVLKFDHNSLKFREYEN